MKLERAQMVGRNLMFSYYTWILDYELELVDAYINELLLAPTNEWDSYLSLIFSRYFSAQTTQVHRKKCSDLKK